MILFKIATTSNGSNLPVFWWYKFDYKHLYGFILSFFSPAIPVQYEFGNGDAVSAYGKADFSTLFGLNIIPTILAFYVIKKAFSEKSKLINTLGVCVLIFVLIEFVAALFGKFSFCARNIMLAFPIVLILFGYGLSLIKNKFAIIFTLGFFPVILLTYKFAYIPKMIYPSSSPVYDAVKVLNQIDIKSNDVVIVPYRGYYLRYFYPREDIKFISFDVNYITKVDKDNLLDILIDKELIDYSKTNPMERYDKYLKDFNLSRTLKPYLDKEALNDLTKENKVVIVYFSNSDISGLIDNPEYSQNLSFFTWFLTKVSFDIKNIIEKENFKEIKKFNNLAYQILVYQK